MSVDLYPHQKKAVDELSNGKILWGGEGVGKTLTAAAYYMKVEADADVYVITTAKNRDELVWEKEFAKFGVGKDRNATVAGTLTVDSWNNIGRYRDIVGAFFIFDEQRLVGSGEWATRFLAIAKRNRWVLLTATPGDNWLDYISVFVANGFYKNRTEFKDDHVVYDRYSRFPKVKRYIGEGKLRRLRDELLVEMPYVRHTTRNCVDVEVEYDKEAFDKVWKKRWHVYEQRPLKNAGEMFAVARKVVNSDESRLRVVRELIRTHSRVIVFYNFNYELDLLRSLTYPLNSSEMSENPLQNTSSISETGLLRISDETESDSWQTPKLADTTSSPLQSAKNSWLPSTAAAVKQQSPLRWELEKTTSTTSLTTSGSTVQVAEWNGHKHEPIPTSDRWVYLVQYTAGAEGWNCTDTDTMVFYSLPYSYKLWHQAHGRIDRLNTPFSQLNYYTLTSGALIDILVSRCMQAKKSFNERQIVSRWVT